MKKGEKSEKAEEEEDEEEREKKKEETRRSWLYRQRLRGLVWREGSRYVPAEAEREGGRKREKERHTKNWKREVSRTSAKRERKISTRDVREAERQK